MKKILAMLLALAMAFSLMACGGGGGAASNPPAEDTDRKSVV